MGRVEKIFQEEGTVDIRVQKKERALDLHVGGGQAGQCGWITERSMRKKKMMSLGTSRSDHEGSYKLVKEFRL